jgi:hypothetical protein
MKAIETAAFCVGLYMYYGWESPSERLFALEAERRVRFRGLALRQPTRAEKYARDWDSSWATKREQWEFCFRLAERPLENLSPPLHDYAVIVTTAIERLNAQIGAGKRRVFRRMRIILSWMHVHNNRIGIGVYEEAMISHMAVRYLGGQNFSGNSSTRASEGPMSNY